MKKLIIIIAALMVAMPTWAQLKLTDKEWSKLESAKITDISWDRALLSYPRQVGKNSHLDIHGYGPTLTLCTLSAGKYEGLGQINGMNDRRRMAMKASVVGKSVKDLIDPQTNIVKKEFRSIDISIYDLIGVILKKPAYKLFGTPASDKVQCYSGMVYLDDCEFADAEQGIQRVVDNSVWDYNYGYRQLKIKIGRNWKWMGKEEGLARDIEITKRIHAALPDAVLLFDPNDAYTIDECIAFLEGIKPIKAYWMEEAFRENEKDLAALKEYKLKNCPDMFVVDGEANPVESELMDYAQKGLLDGFLQDIMGEGFSNWMELLPQITKLGLFASPHCWGDLTKNIYAAHFAMAFGHVPTVEGVTCTSHDLDFGGYKIENGYFIPSNKPGFGITWKKRK